MDVLERTWEGVGNFFGGLMHGFERGVTAVFGSSNARFVRRMQTKVDAINALEPRYQAMSDADLRAETVRFKERLKAGETLDDILIEAFAVGREGGRRFLGMRHYDVQLIGGMVLHSGSIAEMVTGEGKTLVATLPAYLNALSGKGVHVVTVNDYLARRDMEWMGPLYLGLGLTVGAIQSDMQGVEGTLRRQAAYDCDITYGTNNEFGFDYLRDNMRPAARGDERYSKDRQQSQRKLNFAIVDEVDNILIDEARTPLIISGPSDDNPAKYAEADRIAKLLKKDAHFVVNEKDHTVNLTDEGVRHAEKLAGVESFYTAGNMQWPHLIDNALKAHHLYQKDVRYVVEDDSIIIVDEFTGRKMEGRQWSDGLHQAVEAKEGVKIKEETQTLATITLQNFFKLYDKICGMTGTAMTEASEFWKIYELDVVAIPTNRKMQRKENPDVIYRTEHEKFIALADEIERLNRYDVLVMKDGEELWGTLHKELEDSVEFQKRESKQRDVIPKNKIAEIERKGRPALVGTVSIEKSERLSSLLDKRGIKHEVLNAKYHKREAEIIAQAGRLGAVTIATNMAGRGTDIILGGNPETMAWAQLQSKYPTRLDVPPAEWDTLVREIEAREGMKAEGKVVRELGGLHVVGTERHEARRIDLQLRGRCGRQGDPGSSRFFLSLEDDLMRIFAGPWVKTILETLGMKEGERIESRMVSRRIEGAQKKVEERHFEARKNLLEYDEVMDEQRKRVYTFRQRILDGASCRGVVLEMLQKEVQQQLDTLLERDYGTGVFAAFASGKLSIDDLKGRDLRGMTFDEAEQYCKDEAQRAAETHVQDGIDENLAGEEGDEESEAEWNWDALAKMGNARWNLSLRDKDLKKLGRSQAGEFLLDQARASIEKADLSEGRPFLDDDFPQRSIVGWLHLKFGIGIDLAEIKGREPAAIRDYVHTLIRNAYDQREAEYPVMAGLYRYTVSTGPQAHLDREGLIAWARERFGADINLESLKNKQRDEIRTVLLQQSLKTQEQANAAVAEASRRVEELFGGAERTRIARTVAGQNGQLDSLAAWIETSFGRKLTSEEIGELDREKLEQKLIAAIDDKFRPEMRRMERMLLLQIVDHAWMGHLLVMDRLRSSVQLMGYAQVDPKVEFKREGMKLFEQMWRSIGDQATSLIFRMEQLNEEFVHSTWVETSATHAEAPTASQEYQQSQQQTAGAGVDPNAKLEPIRNRGVRPGRNDPCTCGSGKKYKNCCMRKGGPIV
ncbi:MAG TPA: SEC-C metal-binding domain-containing protein [Pirellulaceae bacterium]|nr:SEC-C metal-binding domain-containing protein [Pirellulaceae bacterium]